MQSEARPGVAASGRRWRMGRRARHAAHAVAVALLAYLGGMLAISDRGPIADELHYLAHAQSLHATGVFGLASPREPVAAPGARVAPALPGVIAALMALDPTLARAVQCAVLGPCPEGARGSFRSLKLFNLAWLAGALAGLFYLLAGLAGGPTAWLTVGLVLLSGRPWYYADHFLTEGLYAPLMWLFCACFAIAWYRRQTKLAVLASVLLAVAALTRPSLFYLPLFLAPLVVLLELRPGRFERAWLGKHVACLVLPFALVTAPWLLRNYVLFERAAVTVGYGEYPLSSRVSYNSMTAREYRAGWIYWLPDFGDSLARELFPREDYTRLDFGDPQGFIGTVRSQLRERMRREPHPTRWLLREKVLGDWITHLKVTLLLAWRGAFVAKYFGLVGVVAMAAVLLWPRPSGPWRCYRAIALPPLVLLLFHAAISVNVARYNVSLLLPMAMAMAMLLVAVARAARDAAARRSG